MAYIQCLGARLHLHRGPEEPNPAPDGSVAFGCQLFAMFPDGAIVMASHATGINAETIPESFEELEEMIQLGLHEPSLEPEMRSAVFGNLIDELARLDIRTDLETLMHLPFVLEVSDDVRALIAE